MSAMYAAGLATWVHVGAQDAAGNTPLHAMFGDENLKAAECIARCRQMKILAQDLRTRNHHELSVYDIIEGRKDQLLFQVDRWRPGRGRASASVQPPQAEVGGR